MAWHLLTGFSDTPGRRGRQDPSVINRLTANLQFFNKSIHQDDAKSRFKLLVVLPAVGNQSVSQKLLQSNSTLPEQGNLSPKNCSTWIWKNDSENACTPFAVSLRLQGVGISAGHRQKPLRSAQRFCPIVIYGFSLS